MTEASQLQTVGECNATPLGSMEPKTAARALILNTRVHTLSRFRARGRLTKITHGCTQQVDSIAPTPDLEMPPQ